MARTYKTLSLSLPPGAVERLTALGVQQDKTASRIAAEAVLRYLKADDAARATVSNDDAVSSLLRGAMDSLSVALVWIEQKRRETKRKRREVETSRQPTKQQVLVARRRKLGLCVRCPKPPKRAVRGDYCRKHYQEHVDVERAGMARRRAEGRA